MQNRVTAVGKRKMTKNSKKKVGRESVQLFSITYVLFYGDFRAAGGSSRRTAHQRGFTSNDLREKHYFILIVHRQKEKEKKIKLFRTMTSMAFVKERYRADWHHLTRWGNEIVDKTVISCSQTRQTEADV